MPLVSMKDMLNDARINKYAIGAFDVSNYEMVRAVVEVAEEMRSPVILSALSVDLEGKGMDFISSMLMTAAKLTSVPVCIHLDHAVDLKIIDLCIKNGFTSVMFDGSCLPIEENIRITKEVCDTAHKKGITVEAELGHVTNAIAGNISETNIVDEDPSDSLTSPDEVGFFIENTGVDALAVAIGTAHGVYIKKPVLDFDRLKEINKISSVPLVLHGGSGTPEDDIKETIEQGICKINIYSELINGFFSSLKGNLNKLNNMSTWPSVVYKEPIESMKEVIRKKIIIFGSEGRA